MFHLLRSIRYFVSLRSLALFLVWVGNLHAQTPPDLTAAGAIAALIADTNANPRYNETYNLGPTGLRGWIYVGGGNGADGTFTDASRQILVTVAAPPASAVLAVDDVILGAMAASSGTVPPFSSDCRKAFGAAIGDAEQTGAGTLRVKRWRAGTTTDVNIPMPIMGNYTATAPYSCPKSTAILTNARNKLVGQLLADANFFNNGQMYSRPIHGLALLAGVAPGDPDFAAVQTRLQTYARAMAAAGPQQGGLPTWSWAYSCLFLAEYYLSTNDANVLPGIAAYVNQLVQSQSIYGTFGHDSAALHPDGSGRLISTGYGPVNSVAIVANMAIFMGKKALVAGSQTINPNIDPALQRSSDFFAWYVNKGSIPYGEHAPWMGNHESNGKDPMCAVFFGLQPNRTAETEYFTRMSIAGFNSRESGHTGQGFSYLWGAMGANMGGAEATAEYLENVRWHLDLSRRTDGSFVYDGREGWGPGSTADGTYLGASGYFDLNATACYLLTYALPLQRLYITGKNANPANTLDSVKVAHAVSAATFKQQSPSKTNSELIAAVSDYDPIVRHFAAVELGKRSPGAGELTTLRGMVTGTEANGRMGACQALGLLKDSDAFSLINARLDKTIESNSWVRAQAANALRQYSSATISTSRDALLTRFTANATDPDNIDWDDPLQAANNFLSLLVFGNGVPDGTTGNDIASYTINAPKSLLYPAISAGLKQPDSYPRTGVAQFCYDRLTLADVQELVPDIFRLAQSEGLADRMWGAPARALGIETLAKHKIREGIPVALSMMEVPAGFTWDASNYINPALNAMESYGDAARWTLPSLNDYLNSWDPQDTSYPAQAYPTLVSTIAAIENAITAPTQNLGLAVANPQVVSTSGATAITLTGTSPRSAVTFANVTAPAHGTLTGTAPNIVYTPDPLYSGPDSFSFQVIDSLGAANPSAPGTVSIIVGSAGNGLTGEYFDNTDFTNPKLTRTDTAVNFDWGTGSPHASVGADTFSARWSGLLLVPETGNYTFSTLNSDGVRLYVNGVLMLDQFADQATNWNDCTSISLIQGQLVDLHLLYFENTGSAVAKLKWTGPSSAGANGAIIGQEWLFSGPGLVFTPYAHAQSVSMSQNTPQPVTLNGSGGTLAYTVVTPPANGTLTGTAPNLIYTPNSNYTGTDSFTFRVDNGFGDSAPATVSIAISFGPAVGFTWLNPTSGNMSTAGNWTSGTAPTTGGQPTYQLNFTPSGTYSATHDLNNGFQLNQLNMAGAVTIAGTNSLAFSANGASVPQFNQNGNSAVTLDTPLSLTAMTTVGGTGSGQVTMTQLISGAGGLSKNGPGILQIHGVTQNTYSGGTVVNSGILHLGAVIDNVSPVVTNPLGTGSVTLNGGTIRFDRVTASNVLTVNGGTFDITNGWGATWSGPISGAGTLAKTGDTTITLSGNNSSFSGTKQVNEGILSFTARTAVGTGAFNIATGAKVNLGFTTNTANTPKVVGLTLGGVVKAPGTYGSTSSTATFKVDTYFSGTGRIQVLTSSNTTLALTSGTSPAAPGASLTFTATVTGSSPTGNVSFYDGDTLLGTVTLSSGQASFTTTTLANGTRSITARYAGNTANAPRTSSALAVVILPSAPTIFTPSASSFSVQLAWTQPSGATGYRVKRSLTSGGPYTVVAILGANQFADTTVSDGTQYFYVVSALSGTGEGGDSAQVSISTPANQAPVFSANPIVLPNGVGQSAYTGQTLAGLATDGGDTITFSKVSGPSWLVVAPNGSLSGTPPFGSNGLNSFVVRASDPASASSDVTLQITVVPPPIPTCQLGILDLSANGGINPATGAAWAIGDKYRLAFVTRATTQATSTDIATYNTFVQNVANSSTLNLSGATWKVIGSTATVDARDNTSTNPTANGTGESIFLVNGTTKIANNYADLWNGSINSALNLDERGILIQLTSLVFAGTLSDGTKDAGYVLGTTANNQQVGRTIDVNQYWIRVWNAPATDFLPVYALSDPLTILGITDTTSPTVTSMVDDKSGGSVATNTLVTYTVTFSEDMYADSVSAADLGNAGTSVVTIGTVAETSPGVFTVPVTATTAGTLQLRVNAGAELRDAAGNALVTTAALPDDTTITVNPAPGYATWAATNAPAGTFADDFDFDGVSNGVEYVLGGTASARDGGRLPGIAIIGGNVVFTFNRAQSSIDGTTAMTIETGTILGAWTSSYAVPNGATYNSPGVSVTKNTSPGYDTITLSVPQGTKAFIRLRVVIPAP